MPPSRHDAAAWEAQATRAWALIHNRRGEYLLHLREHLPGRTGPGAWSLPGGAREPGDASLEATVRRELAEEAGLDVADVEPFSLTQEGDVATYSVRWEGDPESLPLSEGVMLRWFAPADLHRLRVLPAVRDLVLAHAARRATESTARPPKQRDAGWLPPEQYAETVLKATAFACVYFTDEDDRPLQLHSVYSPSHPWQLVGGTMDPGERPWETAVRECQEETGRTPPGPPQLLATVYGLPGAEWPYSTFGLVFDGGHLTAAQLRALVLDPKEHDEARVLPLTDWQHLMPGRDFRRLEAVAEARRTGTAAYFDTWGWDT
ncbi:NUDIX domain-containing protein [Streptomyces xiaopingdaonensis]|uniref:NUDIX domain-containing protein n=1 Tax=Streptomyces xiaopingdaonensis TaxID=1565415 RepID=UPI00036DEC1A|nr:NUDIX hydrolase [Streptomyces xiaopingdaonensis]